MIIVGRHINGITLNDLEYLLEDDLVSLRKFSSEQDAIAFLFDKGVSAEEMEFMIFLDEKETP